MAIRKNRAFAKLATNVDADGDITTTGLASDITADIAAAGTVVYDSAALLPISGNTAGDTAFVKSTSRLYIHSGVGWYNVAVINNTPTVQSITDSDGGTTPFVLAQDGTPTTITITAQDSDGDPLTYNYSADSGFTGLATISQDVNVFTITPYSEDSATTTSGTITFSVTDGINTATPAAQTFDLSFIGYGTALSLQNATTHYTVASSRAASYRAGGVDPNNNIYVMNYNGTLYKITGADWINNTSATITSQALPTTPTNTYYMAVNISLDGNYIYVADTSTTSHIIRRFPLSTPYDISSIQTYDASSPSFNNSGYCYHLCFSSDGVYMYTVNETDILRQYTLSTPWDLSTASVTQTSTVTSSYVSAIMDPNGERIILIDFGNNILYEHTFNAAHDISSSTSTGYSFTNTNGTLPIGGCYMYGGDYLYLWCQGGPGQDVLISL